MLHKLLLAFASPGHVNATQDGDGEGGEKRTWVNGRPSAQKLGVAARQFTAAQTYALHLRDGGCTTKGCDWPPGLCHAHHDTPWHHGPPTWPTGACSAPITTPASTTRPNTNIHPDNQLTFHRRT